MCKSAIVAELDLGVYVCDGVGLGVDRSAFWEICESHAKLDAETTVFSEFTLTALVLNTTQEGATVR